MKTLPEHFCIKQVIDPRWSQYITWLNKTYNKSLAGDLRDFYYGYCGNTTLYGDMFERDVKSFPVPMTILTLDQFFEYLNNQ